MRAPGPTGNRQEHLDAIVSFAGAGQRRRPFRDLNVRTIKWAMGDLPEECRFLFNTQLVFLKKEKVPTSKLFDDEEWIRSLAEAQEVTTDVPEDSVTYDQQDVGSEPAMRDQPRPAPRHARGITPDDGDDDDEHPHTRKRTKVQGIITACIDSGVREGLLQRHEGEGSWAARTRLAELCDSDVDHTWPWRLNTRHGPTLEADEYVDADRFRLGCARPMEPVTCAACNSGILDTGAAHASCCALGEATRCHNAVSSLIHAAAQQCDHTSEMEVPGLIPGTDLRPADVLTSALGNAYAALDVSGTDCTQSRVEAKLDHYGPHLAALHRQNISYTPIVWSAYGRPHQDTFTVLRSPSKSIARKRNFASAEVVSHRLHSSITLEIWKRSARQIRTCWPVVDLPATLDMDL